ncbi:LLM class flavin-dependent oxidoreductase [SAR202 cluster bacterium AD-804-J14_MRT_500m]|nr:LLM class flavin-dependent oxidoreductase [SAR202 cluster bacterium AD-804-J14_MRT_500m]
MARIAVRLDPISQISTNDSIELAQMAEQRGYETIWVPEGMGQDAISQLSAFATQTNRIRLGTGILPIFYRTPTLTAMTAAGLDMISGHRFILGLGVGHRGFIEEVHGIPFRRPLANLKETVSIIRSLLKGERLAHNGRVFNLSRGSLGYSTEFPVPIYIAALGPKMIELAGEIADGVLLNWAVPTYIEKAMERLEAGAIRAGRRVDDIDVACYVRVASTGDVESVRAPLRRQILRYASMEHYLNFFAQTGFRDEAHAIGGYLKEGDREKASASITNQMQETLAVFGSPEYCRNEIEKRRALGIKLPVVAPFATGGALNSYRATIETFSG